MHGPGSRNKLKRSHARHYPGPGLVDEIGRALCKAECLPRKELHEAYEVSRLVTERFSAGGSRVSGRVLALCAGFGVLGQVMLLVDDNITEVIAADPWLAKNHPRVHTALVAAFPRLQNRVEFALTPLAKVEIEPGDLVVSAHACGSLTDDVIDRAVDANARLAVMPCCHRTRGRADLVGSANPALALDESRVEQLRARGYEVWMERIPEEVSPMNRLILGQPRRH